jgi:hypothetical protein
VPGVEEIERLWLGSENGFDGLVSVKQYYTQKSWKTFSYNERTTILTKENEEIGSISTPSQLTHCGPTT